MVQKTGVKWTDYRRGLSGVLLFSIFVNLLMLTGPIFMMQIYDRVLSSRSTSTLWSLLFIVGVLYGFMGILDYLRAGVMSRVAVRVCDQLSPNVFSLWVKLGLLKGNKQYLPADLNQLWRYLSSRSPLVFFDLPWVPIYIGLLFILHFVLGYIAIFSVLTIILFAFLNDRLSRKYLEESNKASNQASEIITHVHEGSEAVISMGMEQNTLKHWQGAFQNFMRAQLDSMNRSNAISTFSRTFRLFVQSLMLAAGAWLAIQNYMSLGGIIASSIILGRAMMPIDQMIGGWQGFKEAKLSYGRIAKQLDQDGANKRPKMQLPAPKGALEVNIGWAGAPNYDKPIIERVKFKLEPGQALGIIGPSASGKSTLARLLVGLHQPNLGSVQLSGASYALWDADRLGRYIGFFPQESLLLSGTIRQNICRFYEDISDDQVIDAARQADIHDMILSLPQGYNTQIGKGGALLSVGQRQRIGLARAMFGNPPLIVLDEPNSNLDAQGDLALTKAIRGAVKRGQMVVIIAHRPSAIKGVDLLLVLQNGRQQNFGPKDKIMAELSKPPISKPPTIKS